MGISPDKLPRSGDVWNMPNGDVIEWVRDLGLVDGGLGCVVKVGDVKVNGEFGVAGRPLPRSLAHGLNGLCHGTIDFEIIKAAGTDRK